MVLDACVKVNRRGCGSKTFGEQASTLSIDIASGKVLWSKEGSFGKLMARLEDEKEDLRIDSFGVSVTDMETVFQR